MYKEILIGKKTPRKLALLANGATPLFYKQTFNRDLLQYLTEDGSKDGSEDGSEDGSLEIASDKIPELAYIMARQAEKADMQKLSFEDYMQWLEGFEPLDITMNAAAIANVYISDSIPSVTPKKKESEKQKEK